MAGAAQVPWLRIGAESAAIITSILLAFSIDTWWDERQERGEEADIVADLLAEFRENRELLQESIRLHARYRDAAKQLSERGVVADEIDPKEAARVAFNVFQAYQTFHSKSGVLDSVLTSGKLDLLSDDQLRALLSSWPRALAELTEQEAVTVEWLVATHIALASQLNFGLVIPPDVLGTESFADLDQASIEFLSSTEARSYAGKRVFWEQATLRDAEPLLELIGEIVQALETANDGF